MRLLLVGAALIACAHGGVLPKLDGRIVGGSPATISEAPYQVALLIDRTNTGNFIQTCGGILIANNVVLTSAICVDGSQVNQWMIRAGSTYHNSGGILVTINRYLVHERFNSQLDNDIALMFLSTQISLGPGIGLALLPAQGQVVADGAPAFITGWGRLSESGPQPNELHKVTIPIINQQQCINAHLNWNPVTPNMICAGNLGTGGQDACQGDAGGPLTVAGVLIGITSWGRGCAHPIYPGVWTRVPNYREWIDWNT